MWPYSSDDVAMMAAETESDEEVLYSVTNNKQYIALQNVSNQQQAVYCTSKC